MKKVVFIAVAMALTAPVYAAHATHKAPSIHAQFAKLDANKDGVIDANEAKANKALDAVFSTVAPDGKLDEKAFAAWKHPKSTKG